MAFKWVHDNIRAFGGDPGQVSLFLLPIFKMINDLRFKTQVTIFGESAGSCSVFLQTVSVTFAPLLVYWHFILLASLEDNSLFQPLNTGLVHRAIAQSGGNLGPGDLGNIPLPRKDRRWWMFQINSFWEIIVTSNKMQVTVQDLETTPRARSVPSSLERTWPA